MPHDRQAGVGNWPAVLHFYYSNQWQRVEELHELNGDLSLHAQWLPGARYIDDHVLRDVVSTPGDTTIDAYQRKYYLSDANWNTVAIIGKTATGPDAWGVQERYAYQPYGTPVYLESDFSTKSTQESAYAVENLFQGLALSSHVALYPGRFRVLQTALGTWTKRDPLATLIQVPLLLSFRSAPTQNVDPIGLREYKCGACQSSDWCCSQWQLGWDMLNYNTEKDFFVDQFHRITPLYLQQIIFTAVAVPTTAAVYQLGLGRGGGYAALFTVLGGSIVAAIYVITAFETCNDEYCVAMVQAVTQPTNFGTCWSCQKCQCPFGSDVFGGIGDRRES